MSREIFTVVLIPHLFQRFLLSRYRALRDKAAIWIWPYRSERDMNLGLSREAQHEFLLVARSAIRYYMKLLVARSAVSY